MKIIAPLSGIIVPLEEVPDPVFAKKLAGDGVSIDPTSSVLLSPIDGRISFLHPSCHALTIVSADHQEILIHIGIDTVKLKGQGFSAKVKSGDPVRVGDELISFDADFICTHAKSILTQILWQTPEASSLLSQSLLQEMLPAGSLVEAGRSALFSVTSAQASLETLSSAKSSPSKSAKVFGESFVCQNSTGLHARPASLLAQAAKKFSSDIELNKGEKSANAKSLISILSLEIAFHDHLRVSASGPDAESAVKTLTSLIVEGLGEKPGAVESQLGTKATKKLAPKVNPGQFSGILASPGLVVGAIYQLANQQLVVQDLPGKGVVQEQALLQKALQLAKQEISALKEDPAANDNSKAIFEAHLEMLEDPDLLSQAEDILLQGKSAAKAWQMAYTSSAENLAALKNELLANRAHDVSDVGDRVLKILTGVKTGTEEIPANSIVLARRLTPSQMGSFKKSQVLGFCTVEGGPSSHVAILARSMNLPALTAIPESALQLPSGKISILDADNKTLWTDPSPLQLQEIQARQGQMKTKEEENRQQRFSPAATEDQHVVQVFANIGDLQEAQVSVENGAEGVGLLRSEFLFLHRQSAPSESEQVKIYSEIISALQKGGIARPVVIRTLDVGGDKPLSYLPLPAEENPFLGVRGLRLSLLQPDIFRVQLAAILQASKILPVGAPPVHIMFPMVTSLDELLQAKAMLLQEKEKLQAPMPSIGIMIEVPAAAMMADVFAPHVDFFSIGSNDLTQYVLAIDRGHKDLAKDADGLHPAVLQMIKMTTDAAHRFKKHVGVCGGIASDLQAVPLLLGLGVDELSVSVPAIAAVKAQVRKLRLSSCQELAQVALKKSSAKEVRDLVKALTKDLTEGNSK